MMMELKPKKFYTGGKSGWIDLPFVYLNNNKMKNLRLETRDFN